MRTIPSATVKQLVSASGLALATALVAMGPKLMAQGFNASGTVVAGTATINTTPTTTAITVFTPSAVINWTPNDTAPTGGAINFQDSIATTTYQNDFSISNYAVLNRIIPVNSTRPIQFNGTVISQLQAVSAPPTPGGTLFFYSPGGILVGGSSVFNVGSLTLTTSDLAYDAAGNFDTAGSYQFQPAQVAGSQIVVSAGAQLNASVDGSYIALVAPSIVNNGTINVNGSAALVAADAATITFSPSGLFDIQVDSGTSATGTVAANFGTITGPAASQANFVHRVYMVAVPKNDAITLAISNGNTMGFDIAGAADIQGNAVVLSAGHDIVGGTPDFEASNGGGTGLSSIVVGPLSITSNFVASATGQARLISNSVTGLNFASNVTVRGGIGDSGVFASEGNLGITGDLDFNVDAYGISILDTATAGTVTIDSDTFGLIQIDGNVRLSASAYGAAAFDPDTNSGAAQGGVARISVSDNSSLVIGGDVLLEAHGFGGVPETSAAGGGNGTGGTASILVQNSDLTILGGLTAVASGSGGYGSCQSCLQDGGSGSGGLVRISGLSGGSLFVAGATQLGSTGQGGDGLVASGGAGTGGSVIVETLDSGNLDLGSLTVNASGTGAFGQTSGGNAQGGQIAVEASGIGIGGIGLDSTVNLLTEGFGGSSSGLGGVAVGGNILLSARDEKFIDVTGDVTASANASAGQGSAGTISAVGGSVTAESDAAGLLTISGSAGLSAQGYGGLGTGTLTGGTGTGGTATLRSGGGLVGVAGDVFLNANGNGGGQLENGTAGLGLGGTAQVVMGPSGQIDVLGSFEALAFGNGGSAGSGPDTVGGDGLGGFARLDLGAGALSIGGDLTLDSAGVGGGGAAQGGDGLGGQTSIFQFANTLNVEGTSYIGADGGGGSAFFGSTGGSGAGGTITINANQSTTNLSSAGNATLEATGFGADGRTSGTGTGGTINITATASTISAGSELQVFAEGQGGDGGLNGGDGALGTGGQIALFATGDVHAASSITAPVLNISATGRGGDGASEASAAAVQAGSGGDAVGGSVSLTTAPDGGTIDTPLLTVQAAALGGLGANGSSSSGQGEHAGSGGAATGGQITFASVRGNGTATGGFVLGDSLLNASATGGQGGTGGAGVPPGQGGSGGNAAAGSIAMLLDAGGSSLTVSGILQADAVAIGGGTGPCFTLCSVNAGSAIGGSINIGSDGLTAGNQISVNSLRLGASGTAGSSSTGNGGNATGGTVLIRVNSGLQLTASDVSIGAFAQGGNPSSDEVVGLLGGTANGGNAQFTASGTGNAVITGEVYIGANATGGSSSGPGGIGGSGTGGTARLYSDGGNIEIGGPVRLEAIGVGGDGTIDGAAGGGGNGVGGSALLTVGTPTLLGNNGRIAITGLTTASSEASGGRGFVAGTGTGGLTAIVARNGSLELTDVSATANAFGGNGAAGGGGGLGKGGTVEVFAHNAVEGAASVQIGTLTARATAHGGAGGEIFDPNALGAVGGNAEGGNVSVFGSAGNGVLDIGTLSASADATGGEGGTAVFNLGGIGGQATGGAVQMGLASGIDTGSLNTSTAGFGSITATASGFGGTGGSAEFVGGDGGTGIGGGVSLIVRGGPVTIDNSSTFEANATGGTGGSSNTSGNGGNAVISNEAGADVITGVKLLVTNRFNQPTQRGNLTAAGLSFTAAAAGGVGTVNGTTSMAQRALLVEVTNSSYSGTDLSMIALADSVATNIQPDALNMTGGAIDLSGSLGISTPGTFLLRLDSSDATADSVAISAGNWTLGETTPATLGNLVGTTSLLLNSGLNLVGHANLQSDGAIALNALGDIQFGDVLSLGSIAAVADGKVTLGNLSSQATVDLIGGGDVDTGLIASVGTVGIASAGTVFTDDIAAGTGAPGPSGSTITINAAANISTGNLVSTADVMLVAGGDIGTGVISGYDALVLGHGSAALGGVELANRLLVADSAMASGPGRPGKEQIFAAAPIATAGAVSIANPSTAISARIAAGTTVALSDFAANGPITVSSNGSASFGDLFSSNAAIDLTSTGGSLTGGAMNAALGLTVKSGGAMQLGAVAGNAVTLVAGGALTSGDATVGSGGLGVTAGGDVLTGNLITAGDVFATTPGNMTTGSVVSIDALLLGGGNVTVNSLSVSNRALIANASMAQPSGQGGPAQPSGPPTKDQIFAATPVATGGSVAVVEASTVGSLRVAAGTTVSTADFRASGNIGVTSGGNGSFATLLSSGGNIELLSRAGSLVGSGIDARFDVLASAGAGLELDRVAGRDLAMLSGGDVLIGEARAGVATNPASGQITGATGRLLIANASMLTATTMPGAIDYAALLAANPTASGGMVSITSNAVAGQISITAAGAVNGAEFAGYDRIGVTSGGQVTVAERWTSPSVRILARDVGVIDNGVGSTAIGQDVLSGIRTTQDGAVDIISTSSSPALIGDGLTGSGFALSNDEIGLISTNRLTIAAVDISGNPIDMLIGDLDVTAGGNVGTNTLAGTTGRLIFATGNAASQALSGTIRVTGAINGTGFGSGNVLEFSTGRFELDATTGSISLASTGTTLGGVAEFNATNIHVASATILDRLAANPLYAGRIADLNAPAAAQRPDGVLRALGLDFYPTGTLYIQNTGTALNPAGFFADIDFVDVTAPTGAQPGSISVVVNGAFQTSTGVVGGIDAHDLAVAGAADLSIFSTDSQINGCLFSAAQCASPPDEGPGDEVLAEIDAISGQFEIVTQDPLGSTPGFAEEQTGDEADPEEEADVQIQPSESGPASPIVPPTAIINDSPLDNAGQIDEPVAGSGNPALFGTGAATPVQAGDAQ